MSASEGTKGFGGTIHRAALLPFRYGLSPERIRARLRTFASLRERWEIVPSLPVTACVLDHHREIIADLDGFDLAIHGYQHVAYASLSPRQQADDLDAACSAFARVGIRPKGFRSPYLRANSTTLGLLRERKFVFDSSAPRLMLPSDHPLTADTLDLGRVRYGAIDTGSIERHMEGHLVELPVALPDDEILVDGLRIRNPAVLTRALNAMLDHTRTLGSMLVLQVHPERLHILASAVDALLRRATDLDAWKASLTDAAGWISRTQSPAGRWPQGHPFAVCITGDLDAVSLGDFTRRVWGM